MQKFDKGDVKKIEEVSAHQKKHGLKGRPSNNKISPQKITEILNFLNNTYGTSLPSLAVLVHKIEEHIRIKVSRETLRKLLKEQNGMNFERVRREGRLSPGQKILVTVIGLEGSLESKDLLMLALDRGANELLGCQKICPQYFAKKNRILKEFL
jgi:transposase